MPATLTSLTSLQPNPHWARLPLFERKDWASVDGDLESEVGK